MVETFDLSVVPSADRSTHATGAATLADWIDAVRKPGPAVRETVALIRQFTQETLSGVIEVGNRADELKGHSATGGDDGGTL